MKTKKIKIILDKILYLVDTMSMKPLQQPFVKQSNIYGWGRSFRKETALVMGVINPRPSLQRSIYAIQKETNQ